MDKADASTKSLLETFKFNKVKSRELNELRKQNKLCDLTFKCEDGFEIRVHRIVVASASNYFNDLTLKKKFQKTFTLPGITGDVLEKIIKFIYTGQFKEEIKDVEKVVKYAVKFQLEELVEICSLALSELLPIRGNLVRYAKFARDNLIQSLEDKCVAYFARKFKACFDSEPDSNLTDDEPKMVRAILSMYTEFL